ncbi:vanadium-dependent haloperoxidase [Longirhabdus pacifica]|uniref:vanadium-dependent haloperoxidase n=1 Tax=Longirhabdus pacifica TaxID=2305227 RepID=UPI001F0C8283|nr:vanadium-dependent haloperoxidase [Longirhabdus pacifica]
MYKDEQWIGQPSTISSTGNMRREQAYNHRVNKANVQKEAVLEKQQANGDEDRYAEKFGNFSKSLPHNELGIVDIKAYNAYIRALTTGTSSDFDEIKMGGENKLYNPQAAYAYDLIGSDCYHLTMEPAPQYSSAQMAAEMAELYWRSLTRDVPFAKYTSDETMEKAGQDLSTFTNHRHPTINDKITGETIFRGSSPGNLNGPFLSQFLWKDIPYGVTSISQAYQAPTPGLEFMTEYEAWLAIINGKHTSKTKTYIEKPRYICTGRDLSHYVHQDFSYQSALSACLILLQYAKQTSEALDQANPYHLSATQRGFITFGDAHILDYVAKVARIALGSAWYQKFLVHRRIRPESFGGRVHLHLLGKYKTPIHEQLLHSSVLNEVYTTHDSYLLPMAYPEGCPTHPSYPAGHAVIIGACVTVLKAFFNEDYIIPDAIDVNEDGSGLVPYNDSALTIGGELNKLAANISHGRDAAGLHYRSDGDEGMRLGEKAAISMLQEYNGLFNENVKGFTLTKFDGTTITL